MTDIIHYTANADTLEGRLMDNIGKGMVNARSADYLIERCGFKSEEELTAAITRAIRHKKQILQIRGKYFIAKNTEEFVKYVSRQTDKYGNPAKEYR